MLTKEQNEFIRQMELRLRQVEAELAELKKKPASKRFSPPTLEEIDQLIKHRGYRCTAEHFYHHHNARGWILSNGKPMKCWKSALVMFESYTPKFQPEAVQQEETDRHAAARKRQRQEMCQRMEAERRQHEQDFGLRVKRP